VDGEHHGARTERIMSPGVRRRLAGALCFVVLAAGALVAGSTVARAATATTVSLTFDDGQATHYTAMQAMRSRGMVGTFYINSGLVATSSYYLPWDRIQEIAAAGNEIGGHTVHHVNLTTVNSTAARSEVCDDRQALVAQGFSPTAFAYPEAGVNPTAEQIVRDCGYASGRDVGNLFGPQCPFPYVESVPPPDPYRLRTIDGVTTSTRLADLQAAVTNAETHGGGWVPLVFHGICDGQCTGGNSMSPAIFTAFLDWLAARSGQGTVVRTVTQALSGTSPPTTTTTTLPVTTTTTTTTTPPVTTTTTPPVTPLGVTLTAEPTTVVKNATVRLAATVTGAAAGSTRVAFVLDGATTRPVATDSTSPYEGSWRVSGNDPPLPHPDRRGDRWGREDGHVLARRDHRAAMTTDADNS
jgi:peptidoglycan/xylan/chitin deacetylase (PgdA/CDA1 family)